MSVWDSPAVRSAWAELLRAVADSLGAATDAAEGHADSLGAATGAAEDRVGRPCALCGADRGRRRTYCSPRCAQTAWRRRRAGLTSPYKPRPGARKPLEGARLAALLEAARKGSAARRKPPAP